MRETWCSPPHTACCRGADYKLVRYDQGRQGRPVLLDAAQIARHPNFDLKALLGHRATADVALMKLAAPLPAEFAPAALAQPGRPIAVGDAFMVAGYGVAVRGDGKTGGAIRTAKLVATGRPGSLQLRLVDPVTKGERAGLGACTGDSGAPVFAAADGALAIVGVVSWSTGPAPTAGCGGATISSASSKSPTTEGSATFDLRPGAEKEWT